MKFCCNLTTFGLTSHYEKCKCIKQFAVLPVIWNVKPWIQKLFVDSYLEKVIKIAFTVVAHTCNASAQDVEAGGLLSLKLSQVT